MISKHHVKLRIECIHCKRNLKIIEVRNQLCYNYTRPPSVKMNIERLLHYSFSQSSPPSKINFNC